MMKKILIVLSMLGLSQFMTAQCCDVISSNGMNAVTKNGICVVTSKGAAGDCGDGAMSTGKIDTDGDGIIDSKDACPTIAGVKAFKGCLDSDSDGIADNEDKCPTVKGTKALDGCPEIDTDGDGIADGLDACPRVAGTVNGCPDTDGDGIVDKDDACPTIAGVKEYNGCNDTDKDGIVDSKDACPTVFGKVNGCPDVDSDGVADGDDVCPDVPGILANKGCPEVSEEEVAILDAAIRGVKFQSGKDIITTASYPILNNVVKVLNDKPQYKLSIEGHTDAQGADALNLDLSKKRAAAVKKYLENKGIATTRLTSEGYGETIPVADNNTAAGRAENRRVELKVKF